MPLVFIAAGLVLILTGVKGDAGDLWDLIQGDFSGPDNFIYWMLSIFALGAMGYIPQLRGLSRVFIVLLIVTLLLHNKGFFAQLQAFVNSSQTSGAQQ